MFQIKICGITTVDDALDAAVAGATAVGMNFFPKSKRHVDFETAERISMSLPGEVTRVGVFVNAKSQEIEAALDRVELDVVQLHGNEPPSLLVELPRAVAVWRAFRCTEQGLSWVSKYLGECRAAGRLPDGMLIDADAGDEFGGTGTLADWSLVARDREHLLGLPLILAGGLTGANVRAAIEGVRPDGVDVASGVESEPGRKDARLVRDFITATREAFAEFA